MFHAPQRTVEANNAVEKERNLFAKWIVKFAGILPMTTSIMGPNVAILAGPFFDAASPVELNTLVSKTTTVSLIKPPEGSVKNADWKSVSIMA